jgi:hypothetical protein
MKSIGIKRNDTDSLGTSNIVQSFKKSILVWFNLASSKFCNNLILVCNKNLSRLIVSVMFQNLELNQEVPQNLTYHRIGNWSMLEI